MSEKLWGAAEIGAAINRNPKQTYHLLRKGLDPQCQAGRRPMGRR